MTGFTPQRDIQAISHVNIVVDDIEVATDLYRTVLGFERASNAGGPMDYPGVDLASFARDAGFDDGLVSLDVRLLKHAEVGVDPWGVQWEMEQGRPIGRAVKGIVA
jgi:catechol 2,3-dioxygenase-like lactoylglutathione lyase family enzyme